MLRRNLLKSLVGLPFITRSPEVRADSDEEGVRVRPDGGEFGFDIQPVPMECSCCGGPYGVLLLWGTVGVG